MNVLQAIAQLSAERMLNCIAEGFAIGVFTWALLRAVGRQNSGTRFAVWFSALMAIAALPLFGSGSVNSGMGARPELAIPGSWALYMFIAWAVVATIGLARVTYGLWQVRCLRRSCSDLASVDAKLQSSIEENWATKVPRPSVSVSDRVRVPVAIGFFRPMIIIPTWALRELSPAELNTILLHELAHLRRRDHWTNLAQKIVRAVFFFHPAVWWIEKRISLEREMACDDAVLEQVSSPRAYAECLVSVAEKSFVRRGLTLVQTAVTWAQQTTLRVASILDVHRPGATRVWKPAMVLVTGFSLACMSIAEHGPRLIGFSDGSVASQTTANRDAIDVPRQARVIPAALRLDSGTLSLGPSSPKSRENIHKNKPRRTALLRTKAAVAKPHAPALLLTSAHQPVAPPQVFLVVMQSVQSDGMAPPVWSLCVWRITVVSSSETGSRAKSI